MQTTHLRKLQLITITCVTLFAIQYVYNSIATRSSTVTEQQQAQITPHIAHTPPPSHAPHTHTDTAAVETVLPDEQTESVQTESPNDATQESTDSPADSSNDESGIDADPSPETEAVTTVRPAAGEDKTKRILALGDSLTAGYYGVYTHPWLGPQSPKNPGMILPDRSNLKFHPYSLKLIELLARNNKQYKVTVRGYPGQTAPGMHKTLKSLVLDERVKYEIAVVLFGTNDVFQEDKNIDDILFSIIHMHDRLHSEGQVKNTVVVTIPPIELTDGDVSKMLKSPQTFSQRIEELNNKLRSYARATNKLLIDLYNAIPQTREHAHLWDDSVHYSPAGYDQMGELIFNELNKADLLK